MNWEKFRGVGYVPPSPPSPVKILDSAQIQRVRRYYSPKRARVQRVRTAWALLAFVVSYCVMFGLLVAFR